MGWGVGVDLFLVCYYKLGTDLLMGSSTDITWMGFSNNWQRLSLRSRSDKYVMTDLLVRCKC